jgi:hypothetical protein
VWSNVSTGREMVGDVIMIPASQIWKTGRCWSRRTRSPAVLQLTSGGDLCGVCLCVGPHLRRHQHHHRFGRHRWWHHRPRGLPLQPASDQRRWTSPVPSCTGWWVGSGWVWCQCAAVNERSPIKKAVTHQGGHFVEMYRCGGTLHTWKLLWTLNLMQPLQVILK